VAFCVKKVNQLRAVRSLVAKQRAVRIQLGFGFLRKSKSGATAKSGGGVSGEAQNLMSGLQKWGKPFCFAASFNDRNQTELPKS